MARWILAVCIKFYNLECIISDMSGNKTRRFDDWPLPGDLFCQYRSQRDICLVKVGLITKLDRPLEGTFDFS